MKQSLALMIENTHKKPLLSAVPASKRVLLTEEWFRQHSLSEEVDMPQVIGYSRLFIMAGIGKDSLLANRVVDLIPAGHPYLNRIKKTTRGVDNDLHTAPDIAQAILDSAVSLASAVASGEINQMKSISNSLSWIICGLALIGGADIGDRIGEEIETFCKEQKLPDLPDPETTSGLVALLAGLSAFEDLKGLEQTRCKESCKIILKNLDININVSDVTEADMEAARVEMRRQNGSEA